ncbi:tRNA lysidine(34) synthetase TilS [Alteromonas sp. 5E99-2]|uniref:tRNA lysidine(34) synthetase TilS n=1 Tax=Alteromonas sp. 5E99-2 TaxID=2817683 RepID=UPI001A988FB2|nr:tRNA lysidine(34) synthetase TilS [Alteromonas sp. 5E99-2]MBO1254087.1 tRNA lysidine(34) synthetase TilS [Alteromonas sp. 5E99-2]
MDTVKPTIKHTQTLPQTLWQCLIDTAATLDSNLDDIQWVVAFSGGKDSSALAHVIAHIPEVANKVTLVHVHHGLQKQADHWFSHCEAFAAQLNINYEGIRVTVDEGPRQSIEANARKERYQALREYCEQKNAVLLIAQHEDDQLETVLLQLKRGAGPKGLSAMAKLQQVDGIMQIRPWLAESQASILTYIQDHQVSHIEDPSNQDSRFDRNFLRNEVLPQLTERWPGMAKAVTRTARLCAQQNQLIEEQALSWLKENNVNDCSLPLTEFLSLSPLWQAETLRCWCSLHKVRVPHEAQLLSFLTALHSNSDKTPELMFSGVVLRRFANRIYLDTFSIHSLFSVSSFDKTLSLQGESHFHVPEWGITAEIKKSSETDFNSLLFSYEGLNDDRFDVKAVNSQEYLNIGKGKGKRVKKLFKEKQVPPWCRENTLALLHNDIVIAFIHAMGISTMRQSSVDVRASNSHACLVVSRHIKHDQPV